MALFLLWRGAGAGGDAALDHALVEDAHIVPERTVLRTIATPAGSWRIAVLAAASGFLAADAQCWIGEGEACILHGLLWRSGEGGAPLDAAAVARLLARPGDRLPRDTAGEYAIARLHRCGTCEAFGDPAGVGQLFHAPAHGSVVGNRAALVARIAGGGAADAESAAWIGTIGYRIGSATGWRGVRQLAQGATWRNGAVRDGHRVGPERSGRRGFDPALLDRGVAQAASAIALGEQGGAIPLPITGGKDSRALLAIALHAGLGDRLDLFTRGVPEHPDVVVGARLAAAAGLPHRREDPVAPGGSARWDADRFEAELARLAFQSDGGMAGWDLVTGRRLGRGTQVTGHLGELLRPYAKRGLPVAADAVALVRTQGPFDPLAVLRPDARAGLVARLDEALDRLQLEDADPQALPDLFYLRHRVPNWLGGVRAIKSFERQPLAPLGVPALTELAFRMTAAERAQELAHYRIVERCAPALLGIPFAHQRWQVAGAPDPAPVLAPAGLPLFGNWQFAINDDAAIRARLADIVAAPAEMWDLLDRRAVRTHLAETRFDTFGAMSLLGLVVAALHATGRVRRDRVGGAWAGG